MRSNETTKTNPVFVVWREGIAHCEITRYHDHTLVEISKADLDQVANAIRHAYAGPDGIPWREMALAAIKAWIGDI